jgi:hypothetical protein
LAQHRGRGTHCTHTRHNHATGRDVTRPALPPKRLTRIPQSHVHANSSSRIPTRVSGRDSHWTHANLTGIAIAKCIGALQRHGQHGVKCHAVASLQRHNREEELSARSQEDLEHSIPPGVRHGGMPHNAANPARLRRHSLLVWRRGRVVFVRGVVWAVVARALWRPVVRSGVHLACLRNLRERAHHPKSPGGPPAGAA